MMVLALLWSILEKSDSTQVLHPWSMGFLKACRGLCLFRHGILPSLSALFLELVYFAKGTEEGSSIVMSIGIT